MMCAVHYSKFSNIFPFHHYVDFLPLTYYPQLSLTYNQKVVTKTFNEYIDVFMKIFLDDIIVFSDMSTNLEIFIMCFLKCKEHGIILNLENVHLWSVLELL
jgi:hypothetical protein